MMGLSIQFGAIQFEVNPFTFAIYLPCIHYGGRLFSLGTFIIDNMDFEFALVQCNKNCLFGVEITPFNATVDFLFIEIFRKRR